MARGSQDAIVMIWFHLGGGGGGGGLLLSMMKM